MVDRMNLTDLMEVNLTDLMEVNPTDLMEVNLTDCQVRKLALRTIDGYKKTASSADAMAGGQ